MSSVRDNCEKTSETNRCAATTRSQTDDTRMLAATKVASNVPALNVARVARCRPRRFRGYEGKQSHTISGKAYNFILTKTKVITRKLGVLRVKPTKGIWHGPGQD